MFLQEKLILSLTFTLPSVYMKISLWYNRGIEYLQTMTVQQIIDKIRTELNSNATKLPDAYLLDGVKESDDVLWLKALRYSSDQSFNVTEAYTNLYNATGLPSGIVGAKGRYPFPCDLARPIRIEVDYSGDGTFKQVKFYDIGDFTGRSEVTGDSLGMPFVRFETSFLTLRPLPTVDVENGMHIWYEKRNATLTLTSTPSIDTTLHMIYVFEGCIRAARRWPEWQQLVPVFEREVAKLNKEMLIWYKNRYEKPFYIDGNVGDYE